MSTEVIRAPRINISDDGTPQGRVNTIDFTGTGVSATVSGSTATVAISSGGGGSLTLTTVEVNLGSTPRKAGKFSISTTGLTSGKAILISQANGPYTSKGSRVDEAEMDQLSVSGKTTSTTNIDCYWQSPSFVKGNLKFDYVVSA